jgi:hypothetical protein
MTVRRAVVAGSLLLLVAATLAGAWYYRRPQAPSPTEGAWTAVVATFAGWGEPGTRDGPAELAQFSDPFAIAIARSGRVLVADGGESNRIRAVDGGRVFTVAGGLGEGFGDGPGRDARFHTPSGVAVSDEGTVYVAPIPAITASGVSRLTAGSRRWRAPVYPACVMETDGRHNSTGPSR